MKKLISILLLTLSLSAWSQDQIILRNGKKIPCQITQIDSASLQFIFIKEGQRIASFANRETVLSYRIGSGTVSLMDSLKPAQTATLAETIRERENRKWTSLLTASRRYAENATGWAVQYYGYNLGSHSPSVLPLVLGFEWFRLRDEFMAQTNYSRIQMNYYMIGLSPLIRLSNYFWLNLGFNFVAGKETLTQYWNNEISHTFFGITASQGIYLIPASKTGIVLSIGIYEKGHTSKVYKKDLGFKLEAGIRF